MKKLFTLFACTLILVAFTGCSDKDDDNDVSIEKLIGKWMFVGEYDGDIGEWDWDWNGYTKTLEFRADGTGTYYSKSKNDNGSSREYTWSLDGRILTMTAYSGEPSIIEKLDDEELILAWEYTLKTGEQYIDKALFKRM